MNTKITCTLALLLWTAAPSLPAADTTLNQIYEEGKAAYYGGDLELATYLLRQVEAADPRHTQTKALLAQIKLAMPADGVSLKKKYSGVMLKEINIAEATLEECLQALSIMSRNASDGKVQANFILTAKDRAEAKVTLSMKQVPLPVAIDYVAQLSGTRVKWDKHAVVITSGP
jgi:hypothetical protein